jgi:acyl-CoA oxidase
LVPIRDPKTFKTFPGVEAGDIGPKLGFQNKDNGFAIFNNYRLPRKNMLMKYHIVSKNGEYLTRGNEKISYATMLLTRSGLTETSFFKLSKGSTISVRYSLARSQFKDKEGKEIPILDYQTQQ